jgi:type II restriction enzyme
LLKLCSGGSSRSLVEGIKDRPTAFLLKACLIYFRQGHNLRARQERLSKPDALLGGEMPTQKQITGRLGEMLVSQKCECPRCKRARSLVRLPNNFKCADVICDFCGYLAQVKATRVKDPEKIPKTVLGAAWKPQQERMKSGIYFPLFLVLIGPGRGNHAVFYLSADLQRPEIFRPRKALSKSARRAGWQGFIYRLETVQSSLVRLM